MKAFALIILCCVPLAAVSAWSIVELVTAGRRVARPPEAPSEEARLAMVEETMALTEAERKPAASLVEADLFQPRPPRTLLELPDGSRLEPLVRDWDAWGDALRQTDAVLAAAAAADLGDLDALREAAKDLEKQKTLLTRSPLPGAKPVAKAVAVQIKRIEERIARIEQERQAAAKVALAETALDEKEYAHCIELCDEIEKSYGPILEPTVMDRVRRMRRRAAFWTDHAQFTADMEAAGAAEDRRRLLESLLARYPDPHTLSDAERAVLGRCREQLAAVTAQIKMAATERAAAEAIAELRSALPTSFAERVSKAAEIAARYPTISTHAALRQEIRGWLDEFLPAKRLDESPQLQEVETTRHEIVRGYFTRVNSPPGFKRYPTLEQSIRPVAEVGTYLANQLLGSPSASVPRRALTRYTAARQALIDNVARRRQWEIFAEVCQQLDRELAEYRAKPGSSRESLSFAAEAEFARRQIEAIDWTKLAPLFTP